MGSETGFFRVFGFELGIVAKTWFLGALGEVQLTSIKPGYPPSQEGEHGGTAPTNAGLEALKVPLKKGDLGGSRLG